MTDCKLEMKNIKCGSCGCELVYRDGLFAKYFYRVFAYKHEKRQYTEWYCEDCYEEG